MYVSEGQAAVELFFRLNHARQTMDYVKRQVSPLVELPAKSGPSIRSLSIIALMLLVIEWIGILHT